MKYAMDVKINVKPVFSNMVHSGWWEGPCRVGPVETGTPEFERRSGMEQVKLWYEELQQNLDFTRCNLMKPLYLEFDETFVVKEDEFQKLLEDSHEVDLYLLTYRVPGIERLHKAVSMINLGPTPLDVVSFYRAIGEEAYMAHDYEEYNHLLALLQTKKAVASTKMLILSFSEQTPTSANMSIYDYVGLFRRFGIRNNRIDFRQVFNYYDSTPIDEKIHEEARQIIANADRSEVTEDNLCNDLQYYHAIRKMMEQYDCNAFTTPCKELCASQLPQKYKFVPCMCHSLNKDDRIPSACEEDSAALVTMMMMMYLTRQSVFMGNPVLVRADHSMPQQTGFLSKLVTAVPDEKYRFDHDVLEIHHAVPPRRMNGFDQPEQKYELGHFTMQGWGTHYQINLAEGDPVVTLGRFNREGTRMHVAVARTLGCDFRPYYCSPAVYYDVEGGAREFRQSLVHNGYGPHQCIIYGNHVKELQELGEVMGFEVDYFHG